MDQWSDITGCVFQQRCGYLMFTDYRGEEVNFVSRKEG